MDGWISGVHPRFRVSRGPFTALPGALSPISRRSRDFFRKTRLQISTVECIYTYMPSASDCICFNLRKAARAASRTYDEALAPSGLRNTQFSLLALLAGNGPLPVTELAEIAVMERTTLTRNLRLLERDRLVASESGEDRRQRIVRLTPQGRARLDAALPLWRKAQQRESDRLGKRRKERLLRDLSFAAGGDS